MTEDVKILFEELDASLSHWLRTRRFADDDPQTVTTKSISALIGVLSKHTIICAAANLGDQDFSADLLYKLVDKTIDRVGVAICESVQVARAELGAT